ncbi:hypothetical protein [Ralstonia sp. UBA689]|uniref:hypothetical protein n=1 Tax=Ralstonia sp. UBA689 TaxID=1947373 RepID=UPI0025E9752D|nr:hypothetical protein [Ralstonia sp. UBA689]
MKKWSIGFTAVVLTGALSGCGGGGDGGSSGASSGTSSNASAFTMSASVNGANVPSFSVSDGQSATLTVKSGQDLRFDADHNVVWTSMSAKQTTLTIKGQSTQSLTTGLMSPLGGAVTYVVTSAADSSKSATVTVTVPPQEYAAVPARVGAAVVWSETTTRQDGTVVTDTRTNTTTNITNGIATIDSTVNGAASPSDRYTHDADGNRLTRKYLSNGNVCTYTPKRDMLNFPLSVGKSWQTTWQYSCQAGYKESAALTSTVETYEPVTTPAGTFNALRIHYVLALTNSNDMQLQGGTTGAAAYNEDYRCWWDVNGGRLVKCDFVYAYQGAAPSNYVKTFSQEVTSIK